MSNYGTIITANCTALFAGDPGERAAAIPAGVKGSALVLEAFGSEAELSPVGIKLDGQPETGPLGVIISLYALHAALDDMIPTPFKSFKELPGSMPYAGAFANRTEQSLVPAVKRIAAGRRKIMDNLGGSAAPEGTGGDDAFVVRPLPKIGLCYIFYEADEDFPPSVTCLYSHNAHLFMPTDGLADVGEYTSKKILDLI